MPTGPLLEAHPYEPKSKRWVIHTICRAIIYAQTWDAVLAGAEALDNALRIAKDIEGDAFREDFSVLAAEQRKQSLDQLRELGREIRENQNGGSDETANT